jgi:hypothetical protein
MCANFVYGHVLLYIQKRQRERDQFECELV